MIICVSKKEELLATQQTQEVKGGKSRWKAKEPPYHRELEPAIILKIVLKSRWKTLTGRTHRDQSAQSAKDG